MCQVPAIPFRALWTVALASALLSACGDGSTAAEREKARRAATLASLQSDADRCLQVGQVFSDARACLEGNGYRAFADTYHPTAQAYRVKDRFAIIRIRLDRAGGRVVRWECVLHSPSGRF